MTSVTPFIMAPRCSMVRMPAGTWSSTSGAPKLAVGAAAATTVDGPVNAPATAAVTMTMTSRRLNPAPMPGIFAFLSRLSILSVLLFGSRTSATRAQDPEARSGELSLGDIDIAVAAPIVGRDLVDHDIGMGLRVGGTLFDAVDGFVHAFNDRASLIRCQHSCRHINIGLLS